MVLKYDINIDNGAIAAELKRLTNQIYKLLPSREENLDWVSPLQNLIIEIVGISNLFENNQQKFFQLISKLEGLLTLTGKEDFFLFRKNIFECLNIMNEVIKCLEENV